MRIVFHIWSIGKTACGRFSYGCRRVADHGPVLKEVPAAVTLAQWVIESAWGASMPPGSNNPFGIKAVANQPEVDSQTNEVVNGETITITAKFRAFPSIADAFDAHGRLLATSPAYSVAMQHKQSPDAFADALTGVYATDPDYGAKLKWIMQNFGLERYGR